MAPRAYWKGYLKLSLVSCPIALYPATSSSEKVSFNRINRKTGHRLKQLGGTVLGSMKLQMTQKMLQPPADTTDVVSVIRGVIQAEEEAIAHYNAIIKLCEGNDYVTQDLAIKLLSDERGAGTTSNRDAG